MHIFSSNRWQNRSNNVKLLRLVSYKGEDIYYTYVGVCMFQVDSIHVKKKHFISDAPSPSWKPLKMLIAVVKILILNGSAMLLWPPIPGTLFSCSRNVIRPFISFSFSVFSCDLTLVCLKTMAILLGLLITDAETA